MGGHQAVATGREILPDSWGTLFNRGLRGGFRISMRSRLSRWDSYSNYAIGAKFIMASRKAIIQYFSCDDEILRSAKANRYNCVTNACGLPGRARIGFTLDDRPGDFLQNS